MQSVCVRERESRHENARQSTRKSMTDAATSDNVWRSSVNIAVPGLVEYEASV